MTTAAMIDKPASASTENTPPDALDALANALRARGTGGLSPAAALLAWYDWALHLSLSPGKQRHLLEKGLHKQQRLARYVLRAACARDCPTCIEPLEQDRRFADPAWQQWPFNAIHQGFLLQQQWWHVATTGVHGLGDKHEAQVTFATRQALDTVSPSNFVFTNPEVLQRTLAEGGGNLMRGYWNLIEDWERAANGRPPWRRGVRGRSQPRTHPGKGHLPE
jgi:polyhydroxyalkanoate synthase